jgi:hypothetical protein
MSDIKMALGELRITIYNYNEDAITVIQLRIAVKTVSQM